MPEELVIVLAIIIGAIWLLVKICQGIAGAIRQAAKERIHAAERRKIDRYSERQKELRPYFHTQIPNELGQVQKELDAALTRLELTQKTTHWVARPPAWRKEGFQPVTPPRKNGGYREMLIGEIEAILCQDSDISTWSAEESKIINRQCRYPFSPPSDDLDKFTEFPALCADLKTAISQIDAAHTSDEEIGRYFSDEQIKVSTYNERRAELSAKISNLNSAIEIWNRQNKTSWERYVAECKQMEEAELVAFQEASESYTKACVQERSHFKNLLESYKKREKRSVVERLDYVLDRIKLPGSVPHTWEIDFDEEQQIAVVEIGLPDVIHHPPTKTVVQKSGMVKKPLNQTERRGLIPKVHPAILLRIAFEVFRNDTDKMLSLLVVNGWVKFDDPATGIETKAYTASLMVARDQVASINLTKIDPIAAFENLHGKSAGRLIEIIPIEPVLCLNRNDSRFVNAKEVLKGLGAETNLAAMDWQDFEHLIRELFEKEFSGRGAEVKITQASRDRGVDAIVFDPDPIHGGKYVIQAKRYTNTVDVSAVRDLCAVVKKEGASRGILVTTSTYGGDAYAFANNEPVTLLNGAELLGLLKKHGYTFRINLQEARGSV
jgi:restriction system protein